MPGLAGGFIAAGLLLVLGLLASGVREIPAGHVGVVINLGQVRETALQSGIHYEVPIVNNVVVLDTRVQAYEFADIEGATRDLQAVRLSGVVNFRINPQTAWRLYREVGEDYITKVFTRPAETALKTITPRFNATEIIAKRDSVAAEARTLLDPQIAPYGITVDAFYVANIGLNQAFLDAVEAKQVAEQQVLQQKQILEKARVEAEQRKVEAGGRASAIIAEAQGQAEANRLLTESLSAELIQYTLINKLGPTITTILLPSDQQFILDPKALAGTQP